MLAVLLALSACACKRGSKKASVTDLVARTFAFEGEIEVETRVSSVKPLVTVYKLKGQKARVSGAMGPVISDGAEKKLYLLDDTARTYKVIDVGATTTSTVDAGAPTYKKTGKKDVVAGYECDEYEIVGVGGRTDACATNAIYGPLAAVAGALGAFGSDMGFPLRTVARDPSGAELMRNEVTRIDKRSMPDSEFTVPTGYKEAP
jgi:hypothetical protein